MGLAIFDLDNTLIGGDSDYLWGEYLTEMGIVDAESHRHANDRFYRDYQAGTLNIQAFLSFQLAPLANNDYADLQAWREQFLSRKIHPIMLPKAEQLIARHRAAGDHPLIITATNRFITEPIAGLLGISDLIATDPEFIDGQFTGRVSGQPCYAGGKVTRLEKWLTASRENMDQSWFYSDSHNDLPLLRQVTHPVAVDPDAALAAVARQQGWEIISLRS